jgi:hypothetical protein
METQYEQVLPFVQQVTAQQNANSDNNGGGGESDSPAAAPVAGYNGRNSTLNPRTLPPPPHQTSVWTQPTGGHGLADQSATAGSGLGDKGAPVLTPPMPGLVYVPPDDRMWNFHRKYNKALMDCLAIEREKNRLSAENNQLQDLITQFINGTRVSDEILSSDNPLFVVNGRCGLRCQHMYYINCIMCDIYYISLAINCNFQSQLESRTSGEARKADCARCCGYQQYKCNR